MIRAKYDKYGLFRTFLESRHLKEHPVKATIAPHQEEIFVKLRKLILKMIDLNFEKRLKFI